MGTPPRTLRRPTTLTEPFTHTVEMASAELANAYAALILADDGVEITSDKLTTLIKAAGVAEVEPIWASLFAKALEGKDVKDMLLNVGSGGGAAAGGAEAAAPAEEEKKEEEKEESDEDMGFGLFDQARRFYVLPFILHHDVSEKRDHSHEYSCNQCTPSCLVSPKGGSFRSCEEGNFAPVPRHLTFVDINRADKTREERSGTSKGMLRLMRTYIEPEIIFRAIDPQCQ